MKTPSGGERTDSSKTQGKHFHTSKHKAPASSRSDHRHRKGEKLRRRRTDPDKGGTYTTTLLAWRGRGCCHLEQWIIKLLLQEKYQNSVEFPLQNRWTSFIKKGELGQEEKVIWYHPTHYA